MKRAADMRGRSCWPESSLMFTAKCVGGGGTSFPSDAFRTLLFLTSLLKGKFCPCRLGGRWPWGSAGQVELAELFIVARSY